LSETILNLANENKQTMIDIIHIAAECYPAAKTGGLGDVVGSLPKYLSRQGVESVAIIPKYNIKWINNQQWEEQWRGHVRLNDVYMPFTVYREYTKKLGYELYVVDLPGLFNRENIYSYNDDVERFLVFQQAVLHWVKSWVNKPKVLHCHDHHTGLIPFMVKHCPEYRDLARIPTVFTIHNGMYQGAFSWSKSHLLPFYDASAKGLLDWNSTINPMATGIRCCWKLTTVSNSYLYELRENSLGLEWLISAERHKSEGVLNGIDDEIWDPKTDPMLPVHFDGDIAAFKQGNREELHRHFNLRRDVPLFSFIGRMVSEKGADLIPDAIRSYLYSGKSASFMILGTGESKTEDAFRWLHREFQGNVDILIDYNESLSHLIYAASDFLLMPSRVEPCGLNQMYAMRYGTIPIVRSVGGLKDTVRDLNQEFCTGIRFDEFNVTDFDIAMRRGAHLYYELPESLNLLRERIMNVDFSWDKAAQNYINIYNSFY
jgi:starch synthase